MGTAKKPSNFIRRVSPRSDRHHRISGSLGLDRSADDEVAQMEKNQNESKEYAFISELRC